MTSSDAGTAVISSSARIKEEHNLHQVFLNPHERQHARFMSKNSVSSDILWNWIERILIFNERTKNPLETEMAAPKLHVQGSDVRLETESAD